MNKDNQHVILVVEDDLVTSKTIELILKQYQIFIAATGEAALNIVKQNASVIDLILLDIVLPGIDGIATCRKLKENPETIDIPVIFLTVKDEPEKEVNGFDVGAVDFIPKPVDFKVLNARVKAHLELKDYRDNLKQKVEERTREVEKRTAEIVKLKQDIIDTQKEIIFTLSDTVESKSNEAGEHVKRMSEYAYLLAQLNGMQEKDAEILRLASILHDIGKVGIPDCILNKPGKFTNGERIVMQSHSQIGYDILKNSNREILKLAAIIALQHQEKYNGTGYPKGLKGEDIDINARIVAIADSFDAMASVRVYKKAFPKKKIKKEFKDQKEKQFDPILANLFLKNFNQFWEIFEKYSQKGKEEIPLDTPQKNNYPSFCAL